MGQSDKGPNNMGLWAAIIYTRQHPQLSTACVSLTVMTLFSNKAPHVQPAQDRATALKIIR